MLVRFAQSKHIFGWVILGSLMFGMLAPAASGLALAAQPADKEGKNPESSAPASSPSAPNAARSEANTSNEAAGSGSNSVTESCIGGPIQLVKCAGTGLLVALKNVFAWLAGYAAALFVWVVNPGNMSGSTGIMNTPAVYEMWKFVRDFFNLFFILILLLSAFATVFQVENFSIRKIFLNILIAALIINFSFPITRFLIDLTNVPMYYFLNAILPGQPGGEGFVRVFLATTGLGALPMAADGAFTKAFFDVVFTFLLAVSLLVLGVMFTIRLIALTLLLIFSPFGFAAALMPGFQKLGQEWWGKFWSYAFFGPSAALVLLVAIRFMESVSVGGVYLNLKQTTTNMTAGSPEANSMATMLYYLIPIILIWTAIGMANRFSIAGAGKVVGWGETFSRWTAKKAGRGVWGAAKYVDRKVEKKMADTRGLRWLSPRVLTTAIKNRAAEQKHKDEAKINQGAARVQDKLNEKMSRFVTVNPKRWFHKGIDVSNHEFEESQHQAAEERKHATDVSTNSDYLINELKDAIVNKQANKADGILQALASQNDLNDTLLALGKEYGAATDENGKVVVSSENMLKVLPQILAASGEKNADLLAQRMMVIGEKATGSGNYAFGGMVQFNKDADGGHGKFEIATPEQQARWAAGKVKNLESQKRQTTIHPDSLFTRNEDGKFGDLNGAVAESIVGTYTQGDVNEARRSRDDLKSAIHNAYQNIDEKIKVKDESGNEQEVYKYQKFRDAYYNTGGNTAIFKDYVNEIEKLMKAKSETKSPEEQKAADEAKAAREEREARQQKWKEARK